MGTGIVVAGIWRKARRFIYHRILHADDTPHRIALGVAIGLFVGLTPTVGLQMMIALALATALRANKLACVPIVWITNPVTLAPIYLGCYLVGAAVLGIGDAREGQETVRQIEELVINSGFFGRMLELDFWRELASAMGQLGVALWLGCFIIALPSAVLTYFASRWGVTAYRVRRRRTLEARHKRREERRRFARRRRVRAESAAH